VHATTVAFEPRGLLNSMFAVGVIGRIVHTERRVVVVRARLRSPRSNTAVHLLGDPQRGQGAAAQVRLAGKHHAALLAALAAADYDVDPHHTRFSLAVVSR
jgi:hypothetical protein